MRGSLIVGIIAALFAAFVWSLNFAVPFVIGKYTVFDFALLRFGISGLVGAAYLVGKMKTVQQMPLQDWLVTAGLAFIGYVGYFLTVTGAAIFAGPVIAPAFLGLVPIVLAIIGNARQGSAKWRDLSVPLSLVALGLILVNWKAFAFHEYGGGQSLWIGIPMSVGAVSFWTWFAVANESALASRPATDPGIWSALTLFGGGVEMILFFPLGSAFGLFGLSTLGAGWHDAGTLYLYLWGTSLALVASVGGVWAWNVANRHLPIALAAQLIVSETAFGAIFGLAAHGRWPTLAEAIGIAVLVLGVVSAIHVFHNASKSRVTSS